MDDKSIDIINFNTSKLYKKFSHEFSNTRSFAWKGWERLTPILQDSFLERKNATLLDIGCGNLRFEKYLESVLPNTQIDCTAVDNCPNLLGKFDLCNTNLNYYNFDIVESLKTDSGLGLKNNYDLVVLFGLLHHIPTKKYREKLIDESFSSLDTSGLCLMSFWQFMKDDRLSKKALAATKDACKKFNLKLEDNDYFLNWGNDKNSYRFCHNFTDSEVDTLCSQILNEHDVSLIDDFNCDGPNNVLNRYLVFLYK